MIATIADLSPREFDFDRTVITKEYRSEVDGYFMLQEELDALIARGAYTQWAYERSRRLRIAHINDMIALQSEKNKLYDSWYNGHRDSNIVISVERAASPERYVWGNEKLIVPRKHNYPKNRKPRKVPAIVHVFNDTRRKKKPFRAYYKTVHIGYFATEAQAVAAGNEWFTHNKAPLT